MLFEDTPNVIEKPVETKQAVSESNQVSQVLSSDPTPPLIARVNGEAILLSEFEKRVQQFEEVDLAKGRVYTPEQQQERLQQIKNQVLDGLIDQIIIAQAAQKQGIIISEEALNLEIAEMKQNQSEAEFEAWLALNDYSYQDFKNTLQAQLIASELFNQIASQTPTTTQQVHARHILVHDLSLAQDILMRLNNGEDFVALAQQFSKDETTRLNGGDLGWFPQGVQIVPPQLEEIAFSLAVGKISPIIETVWGYHIVKVELKEDNRPLTPQHWQILQANSFNQWLAQQRVSAHIERFTEDYSN